MVVITEETKKRAPTRDPERTVSMNISGFTKAGIEDALMKLVAIEHSSPLALVEQMIAERARAAGIDVPKTNYERNAEVAATIKAKQAQRNSREEMA
ncbi:hypothetical protein H9Q09_00650 [Aurantimonas sp. DM33-3]|uniref:hypothetical protein n=1 Tax=Aurantimonas sp. DM33-3 TaxID=2766955 RepID=UPI0016529F05|nr:hypothetical protein [Aurantimonas sp. DM33-3]MBC6714694.1 hypothetical protein [Aurantimonas sp. DM33-3]